MSPAELLLRDTYVVQFLLGFCTLCVMVRANLLRKFLAVATFLVVNTVGLAISTTILFFRRYTGLGVHEAYHVYFYANWCCFALQSCLPLFIIYNAFNEAMRPFDGLRRIGRIIFRWAGVVSIAMAFAFVAGPEMFATGTSASEVFMHIVVHLQQCISILTVCLLVFVTFAVRPLGINYRSRIFGVTLGLGIVAVASLVQAAWLATSSAYSVYSPIYLVTGIGFSVTICIWAVYFGLPEPEAKLILLPTTSPFFHWNRISEILGDAPGKVAISGLRPEMLAPAEIEIMTSYLQDASMPAKAEHGPVLVHSSQPTESRIALAS